MAQDRLVEKRFINGMRHTRPRAFTPSTAKAELDDGAEGLRPARACSRPAASAMTARARSVFRFGRTTARKAPMPRLGGVPLILESFVAFEREISVIAARAAERYRRRLRSGGKRPSQRHPRTPRRCPRAISEATGQRLHTRRGRSNPAAALGLCRRHRRSNSSCSQTAV